MLLDISSIARVQFQMAKCQFVLLIFTYCWPFVEQEYSNCFSLLWARGEVLLSENLFVMMPKNKIKTTTSREKAGLKIPPFGWSTFSYTKQFWLVYQQSFCFFPKANTVVPHLTWWGFFWEYHVNENHVIEVNK